MLDLIFAEKQKRQQGGAAQEPDYSIKSQDTAPAVDTSSWPLLLKNYDKLCVRTGHYTPIPSGATPLKRELQEYIRYARFP